MKVIEDNRKSLLTDCSYQLTTFQDKRRDLQFAIDQLGDKSWQVKARRTKIAVFTDPKEFNLIKEVNYKKGG